MFPRWSLPCQDAIRFVRPLLARIIAISTLFVAVATLRHVSIGMEVLSLMECRGGNHRINYTIQNPCQQPSHLPVFFNNSLGMVSKIYVISLPRRNDRRIQMDLLKDALHLDWTYRDACEANASAVTTILRQVHVLRNQFMSRPMSRPMSQPMPKDDVVSVFNWPRDMEDMVYSREKLRPLGADLWTLPSSPSLSDLAAYAEMADPYAFAHKGIASSAQQAPAVFDIPPLACTSENDVFAAFSPNLPLYRHLTAAKVACWYSHLQTIRDIANGEDEAALVLEDDVDIERDVKVRLRALWNALPSDWDIVYLGASTTHTLRQ